MTAITEFERLEAPGLWRETADAQRRDVIVSVGDATLVLTDSNEVALSHWSLPAVERVSLSSERPAIYRPGLDADELLEIDDEVMIHAIDKVQAAIDRRRPHPGRLRSRAVLGGAAVLLGLAVFWLPGAMRDQALRIMPDEIRARIGAELLDNIRRVAGGRCETAAGRAALGRMHARLLGPEAPGTLIVLPGGVAQATHLPGGIILLNRALVEDYEEPEVVAGFVLAEDARADAIDPLRPLLDFAGFAQTAQLVASGQVKPATLAAYGEALLTEPAAPLPDEALLARFAAAEVSSRPYAYALDVTGEATLGLIEADPAPGAEGRAVLSDDDWVALQGICEG